MAKLAQDWIATNSSEFIGKDEMASELAWPQPSGLPCLGSNAWTLQVISTFQPKPENIDELKKFMQLIWDQLPQVSINKAILSRKNFGLVWKLVMETSNIR